MTIEQMIARQQELLNAARSAGRNMTREEAAEFDSLQRSIDAARAAGAGIAHGGQSSTPAAPANNTPEGQRQQTPAAGEGGNGGQDPQNAQRAIEAERQRIRSIEDLCTEFGLEARSYIDNGSTEEQVRAAVLEHLRSQHSPVATGIQVTDTQEDKFRRAAADSLLMRSGMTLERPEDGARSLMGMSIRDLAIECLQRDGSSESKAKTTTLGKVAKGKKMESEVELEILYIKVEINNAVVLELDKLNFVFVLNGKDMLAQIRSQC